MWYKKTALILAAVGAMNWALDMWEFNLVGFLSVGWLMTLVYYLIAISGLYVLVSAFK